MKAPPDSEPAGHLSFARAPLLHGAGPSVHGDLVLTNEGADAVRLREVTLRVGEVASSVPVFGQIPAHATGTVAVTVPLEVRLPAGTHTGSIMSEGVETPVTVVVAAVSRLRLAPATLTVTELGSRIRQTLIAVNQGTVPLAFPDKVAVGLTNAEALTDAVHYALRTTKAETFQTVADAATRRFAEAEVRPAVVHFRDTPAAIEPGETRELAVEIQLPRELQAGVRYTGQLRLYTARVRMVIEAYGQAASEAGSAQEESA